MSRINSCLGIELTFQEQYPNSQEAMSERSEAMRLNRTSVVNLDAPTKIVNVDTSKYARPRTYYACPYCSKEMPADCPNPTLFSCCGEIGHYKIERGYEN